MKDIKEYVCTQAQSKKLSDLGVKQDSLFFWTSLNDVIYTLDINKNVVRPGTISTQGHPPVVSTTIAPRVVSSGSVSSDVSHVTASGGVYSAFTLQELKELIYQLAGDSFDNDMSEALDSRIKHDNRHNRNHDNRNYHEVMDSNPVSIIDATPLKVADFLIKHLEKITTGSESCERSL